MIKRGPKTASVETRWRMARALELRLSELIRIAEDWA